MQPEQNKPKGDAYKVSELLKMQPRPISSSISDGLSVSAAITTLERKLLDAVPGGQVAQALQMAIDALRSNVWTDVSEKLPELPDQEVCAVSVLAYTSDNTARPTFLVYQREIVRGKRVERWLWHDRIFRGTVLKWRYLPEDV